VSKINDERVCYISVMLRSHLYLYQAFQKSVADTFKAFQSLPYWKVVDATLPMEKVEEGVQSLAAAAIKRAEEGEPLLQLW